MLKIAKIPFDVSKVMPSGLIKRGLVVAKGQLELIN